jgi:hypothetical protein
VNGEGLGPGAPAAAWRVDPANPRAAELEAQVRAAPGRGARLRLSGILWEGERTAELVAVAAA